MSAMNAAGSRPGSQAVLGALALAGAAAFAFGLMRPQPVRIWAIYLVILALVLVFISQWLLRRSKRRSSKLAAAKAGQL